MIKLTGNLVNETITRHPSFQYILPEKERMGDLMDSAVNNLYVAGRSWITKKVSAHSHVHRFPFCSSFVTRSMHLFRTVLQTTNWKKKFYDYGIEPMRI